jgi:two-component system cell cycle sensor histidine kinase/response regulator CckA
MILSQTVDGSVDKATLEETVALLEATLESTEDAILVVGPDRRITRFNHQFVKMFQLPADIIARLNTDEMIAVVGDQLEDSDAVLLKSPELWTTSPKRFLPLMHFKDGRVFERTVSPYRFGGTVLSRIVRVRDISRSVRAEQALEQHRKFLEKAQEVAHVGSWVAELDGSDRLGWSLETHRIFGVPPGEFKGTSEVFFDFVHPDDRDDVRTAAEASIRGERPYDIEHRIVTGGNGVRWVHEKADVVRDASGHPLRMIGTVQDITDRRQLEEQLRHAQKLDAIGRLAGGIAHDLNNALTAIAGYTELALNVLREDHPAHADIQEVRRAAERAASVTRQLLAFSRKQLLEPRLFNLNEIVISLARLLERLLGEDVRLETELSPELPPIHADPGQIEQAIINLAVNARDAMPKGGRILLATAVERVDQTFVRPHASMPPGAYVRLRVIDNGQGMTRETQDHIFEPFFTTKPAGKGTGLGLAMVWGTVKQSGGFIFVDSEPEHGTTFHLYFPIAVARGRAASGHQATAPASRGDTTLLVVEDEDVVRAMVTSALEREGYRVLQAASAKDAHDVAAKAGAIDLLLTDATMPDTNGIDLARALIAERPLMPVIVMSGYAEEVLTPIGLPGPVSVLKKPFTPSELRQRIREALDKRTPPVRLSE